MKISRLKNFIAFGMTLVCVSVSAITSHAQSYTYSLWDEAKAAPDAYEWTESIRGKDLGIDSIKGISDIYYRNGKLYIAMTGKILVTDSEFNYLYDIDSYTTSSGQSSISNPTCVFVTEDDEIYVAEEALGEIVEFDANGEWVRTLTDPGITGLESVTYAPSKVVVDENGRIYVKAKSVYEGIIELDPDGSYSRFVGANEVSPTLLERFYRLIATEEQLSRMSLWLPTDYSDIAIDQDGFLMATVKDNSSEAPIRKLNSAGSDIMTEYDTISAAMGDYEGDYSISQLTCIATSSDGRFAALDSIRSRVFVYSSGGILVYTLGGSGKQEGSLNSPVDICFMEDKILVADLVSMSIEVYEPTSYGQMINNALRSQGEYDYETAAEYWEQVYDVNPDLVAANLGLGKQALRAGDYESAMTYFKACGERESYSQAYEYIREKFLNQYFALIILIVILFFVLVAIVKRLHKKISAKESYRNNKFVQILGKIKYTAFTWPGYMLSHPFKAFDDVKYENAGSNKFAVIILILFTWSNLIKVKYAGFIVNEANTAKINVPLILVSTLLPYVVFIFGNWAVGTLIDGKGTLGQVLKITAYALYPTVFLNVIGTIVSRGIIYDERLLVYFLFYFPMFLFAFYCFIGIVMVHQFTFTKGLASVLITIVAMLIIIFIIVLLVTLVSGFCNDVMTIWDEFSLYYL
ncbi:MAG: hypothetical protein E7309_04315 [Butyrivibrio sp.]|nr:hypothetical protein [Butyrivibrio sp.]